LTEDQGASFDYLWQDGSDETSYEILMSGTYSLSISNACGLEISNSTIVVLPNDDFEIEIEDEYVDCEGEEILVDIAQQIGSTIEWFDGSTDWSNSFIESGLYSLSLFNDCRDTLIDLLVRFEDCDQSIDIYIPNTFTPDEDGVNDFFTIYHPDNREILSSKISIYNRWGEQMFYSEETNFQWYGDFKGRSVQSGVYVYIYEVEFIDGEETISRTEMGDLTVLR
jgi:gliding motility-associated-like protein